MKEAHPVLLPGAPAALVFAVLLPFVAALLYGLFYLPALPYRTAGEGYQDKNGCPRTAEEFRAYRRWRRVVSLGGTPWALLCVGATTRYYVLQRRVPAMPSAPTSPPA